MKNKTHNYSTEFFILILAAIISFSIFSCESSKESAQETTTLITTGLNPASDPLNKGGWVLQEEISDEFDGNKLDTSKWFIEGQNGDYYIWKGRAPSQFVPHNVIVENGKLKLRTQWEPSYNFAKENYADGNNNNTYGFYEGKPLPVTTAGIVSKKRFLNGYMEVKSKVGNAAITGAFWAIGYEQELDVFEQMGNPKIKDGSIRENSVRTAVHDWSPPAVRPTKAFGYDEKNLSYRTADEFHIYGVEWGIDYLKVYRDGELTYQVNQDELGTDWVLNNPMEIWLDSEIFNWLGVPHKEELPVDFEIEYMRVWQKTDDNILPKQFFGFEGPVLFENNPRPLDLLPESSVPDDYQKFWIFDSLSTKYLKINEGQYATGVNSLEFTGFKKNEKFEIEKATVISPEGAFAIDSGDFELSLKIWLTQGRAVDKIYLSFTDPELEIPLDITGLERNKWMTLKRKISRSNPSSPTDQFKIEIRKENVPAIKAAKLYIDDIQLVPIK